jgi:aminopeptidase-like protein/spore coat polysaccharide biosynthesis protein SpsF (cytidylyltransferase family)
MSISSSRSILGVIQARTNSSRFPAKSLAKLGDRSVLEWVLRRVEKSLTVKQWVVATSSNPVDDELAELARHCGFSVFRGDEFDVLSRFIRCAEQFGATHLVRVCADNPFVWGPLIDDLVLSVSPSTDYSWNHRPMGDCEISDGFGAEFVSAAVLNLLHEGSTSQNVREHVTFGLAEGLSDSTSTVRIPKKLQFPYLRFDVDTSEQLAHLNLLVTRGVSLDTPPEEIIKIELTEQIESLLLKLFPLNRSLLGEANRSTLDVLAEHIPLVRKKRMTGERVFDWEIPKEWSISAGFIRAEDGRTLVDFRDNSLHVVSYSEPIAQELTLAELLPHLHVHSNPEFIPYRTAYYESTWGFCVTKAQYDSIVNTPGKFHVLIDSEKYKGVLDYGELVVPGKSSEEVLVSCYICHPNLANDSLSGVVLTLLLARHLLRTGTRWYTYRFVFVPETIGALVVLDDLGSRVEKIKFGLQVTTVGGPGAHYLKESWNSNHPINMRARRVLEEVGTPFTILPFDIHGSDERQYSSPGFRLNMITIAKDIYYSYPEYHSSGDDLSFVSGADIVKSLGLYLALVEEFESETFVRCEPRGEPMLRKHDLYDVFGGSLLPSSNLTSLDLVLWVLFLTGGDYSVRDIAEKLCLNEAQVAKVCTELASRGLLRKR